MKINRWILVSIVLAVACLWILKNKRQAVNVSTHPSEVNSLKPPSRLRKLGQRPNKQINDNVHLTRNHSFDQEAIRLVEEVRAKIRNRDVMGFHNAINSILYRYEGDPNPLIIQLIDLLKHEDRQIRIYIADVLLLTDMETEVAKQTLLEIIRSPVAFMSKENKEEAEIIGADDSRSEDLRIFAANTIAKYGIKDGSENIWNLYQNTRDCNLVRPLRKLNASLIIDELKTEAVMHLVSIKNMKLIGEYRYEEALPELKRRYADKSLSADIRFRTLFPLWRITGDEKYFDEFAASFLPTNIPVPYLVIGSKREHQYLIEMLNTAKSDQLYEATMALHLKFKDDEPIKKMLIGYYQHLANSNWGDPVLARRLVGSIDDENLTEIAKDYEAKYPTGYFERDVIYKKNWRYPEWEEPLLMY